MEPTLTEGMYTRRLADANGETVVVTAEFLGFATSRRNHHRHPDKYATPDELCRACRWFEVTLYRAVTGDYLVHTVGRSDVPGEVDLSRVRRTESPYEVVEILTQYRDGHARMPRSSALALSRAANRDDGIRDAYVNRAVA